MKDDKKSIVIKYGGHAMDIPEIRDAFVQDLKQLKERGYNFVIVHGGGPHIAKLLNQLNIESRFEKGLRVTDERTLEAVEMVLCGQVNKEVTRFLKKAGLDAVGISGEDGSLIKAKEKDPSLGRVGEITEINQGLILNLLNGGYLPVVAPLGLDENLAPLNINADTAAGAISGAIGGTFILLSDVPGVLDKQGDLIQKLNKAIIYDLIEREVISGGMIPKVQACLDALECGCDQAIILDGRQKNSLGRYLSGQEVAGTVIYK